jgi:AbrB family looped-hinge helix DNA binding protein
MISTTISTTQETVTAVEATVTSKGQVTLPSELRKRLGIQRGSRIRFSIPARGAVRVEPVLYDLEDLWKMADSNGQDLSGHHGNARSAGPRPARPMTFAQMDAAKIARQW